MKNIQSRTDPARVGSEDRHYWQPSKKIEIWTVDDSHYNAKESIRNESGEEVLEDEGRKSHSSV